MPGISRRAFLSRSPAVAGLTVADLPHRPAVRSARWGEAASAKLKLATHVPSTTSRPTSPGRAAGLDAGFLCYPKNLVRSVTKTPGDGKTITALTEIWTQPPPRRAATGTGRGSTRASAST